MLAGSLPRVISVPSIARLLSASLSRIFCRLHTNRALVSGAAAQRGFFLSTLVFFVSLLCSCPTLAQTVQSLNLVPAGVTGGSGSTGTVMLSAPATANTVVTLVHNTPSASYPATLTIPQGQQSGSFAITTTPVAQQASGTIGATINNQGPSVPFTVYPATFNIPGGFILSPTAVTAGQTVTGTLTLDGPAPTGGLNITIAATEDAPVSRDFQFPATVTVPAGQSSTTFTIQTGQVNYLTHFNFTATLGSVTLPASFMVTSSYLHVVQALNNGVVITWDGQANGNFIVNNGPNTPARAILPNSVHTYTYLFNSADMNQLLTYGSLPICVHDSNGPYSCFDLIAFGTSSVLGNQAVDSRLDLRYSTNVFLNHNFGTTTYRGGLFAGMATDQSNVGHSYVLFNMGSGYSGTYRCGGINAYLTGIRGTGTSQPVTVTIGCQALPDSIAYSGPPNNLAGATPINLVPLVWSTAPLFTPAQATNTLTLTYDPANPTQQWCNWTLNADIYNVLQPHSVPAGCFYTNLFLLALAAVDETKPGWAYFAKNEFDSTHKPSANYVSSMPTLVSATATPSTLVSLSNTSPAPQTVAGSIYVPVNGIGAQGLTTVYGSCDNPSVAEFATKGGGVATTFKQLNGGLGYAFPIVAFPVTHPTVVHFTFTLNDPSGNPPPATAYNTVTVAVTVLPPGSNPVPPGMGGPPMGM